MTNIAPLSRTKAWNSTNGASASPCSITSSRPIASAKSTSMPSSSLIAWPVTPVRLARTPFPWGAHRTLDRSRILLPPRRANNQRPGLASAHSQLPKRAANPPTLSGHGRVEIGDPLGPVGGPWTGCRVRRHFRRAGLNRAPDRFFRFLTGSWAGWRPRSSSYAFSTESSVRPPGMQFADDSTAFLAETA
jgi:hypothetical protein